MISSHFIPILLIILIIPSCYCLTNDTTSVADFNLTTLKPESKFVRNIVLSFVCIPIIMSTLIGNMLVILAVVIVRKLHTQDNANNFLIVSLALSDFLVGVLVMPFALYVEISEENKWHLGSILCDLWTMSDVLLCTASILNLCAISIDRYFIILHAFVYTQRRNAKLMFGMILIVWLLSALTSIPPLFGWGRKQKAQECTVSDDLKYQIYATLLAFYLPSALMITVYINIYRAARKIKKRELETTGRLHNFIPLTRNITIPSFESNHTLLLNSCSISSTHQNVNNKNCTKKTSFLLKNNQNSNNYTSIESTNAILIKDLNNGGIRGSYLNIISNGGTNLAGRLGRRVTQVFSNIKCNSSQPTPISKNQKATRTLGVIMGCFILCWLPFFILAILKPIRVNSEQKLSELIPKWLDSFLLWLGYFNSALNPMIYARFNREFRRPFIEILCFRCRNINNKLRDEERKKMYSATSRMDFHTYSNVQNNNTNQSTSFNSINKLKNDSEIAQNELLITQEQMTTSNKIIKQTDHLNEIVDSTIEIETIKEKFFTIKLNESNVDANPSYLHLNEINKSTQVSQQTNDSNKYQSIQSIFEQSLNSETNSDKSHLSITLSSLTAQALPTITLTTTTTTTLTTQLENEIDVNKEPDITEKVMPQRSKTSKKRKLHSKLNSDNFKKHYKSNTRNHRLAYCTFNKKFPKRICITPSVISRIKSYANEANSNNKGLQLSAFEMLPFSTSTSSSSSSSSSSSEYCNSSTISKASNNYFKATNGEHASYLDFNKTTSNIIASESCV